ncbi:hypothetical protein lerEdw1_013561 [Lerista edwardsae]|nr:hypothetical protein lerEdw1_013564 [Lerista edwardsae]KAJ6644779.1 hypothetical protein lerEdw1_013561 [Lerista edwardsae]
MSGQWGYGKDNGESLGRRKILEPDSGT